MSTLEEEISSEQQLAIATISDCYKTLQQQRSNVVWELLKTHAETYQWNHYPSGDVIDKTHHSQYYFHSHPSKDEDRVPEHGHFHLFLRKGALPNDAISLAQSKKFIESQGKKDALVHVVAIAMNETGYPTALFTVNHWVVYGLWYPAAVIANALDQFCINIKDSPYSLTNCWITHMVKLFKPQIIELLNARDAVIAEHTKTHPDVNTLEDHQLEITSIMRLVAES